MKKDYIKPEIHLEDYVLDNLMLAETSKGNTTDEEADDGFAKDRDNTGDSSWGDLW